MTEPQLIWRLGRWLARREPGKVALRGTDVNFVLTLRRGRIVGITGIDPARLGQALRCESAGETDLISEARALASARSISESAVMGAAKQLLQEHLRRWYLDEGRELQIDPDDEDVDLSSSISATHAVVEMLLSEGDGALARTVLPNNDVLLRRSADFLDLYAPLGLAEEADLIVAKITGQRTAQEIASRSSHEPSEILRLLAALIATGMLEAVPAAPATEEPIIVARPEPGPELDRGGARIRLSPALVLGALAVVAVIVFGFVWWLLRPEPNTAIAEIPGSWTIAVDLGCEPHEYRRMLQIARNYDDVRPVALTGENQSSEESCWRLVWGTYPTAEEAEGAIESIPEDVLRDGFEPHIIQTDESEASMDENP